MHRVWQTEDQDSSFGRAGEWTVEPITEIQQVFERGQWINVRVTIGTRRVFVPNKSAPEPDNSIWQYSTPSRSRARQPVRRMPARATRPVAPSPTPAMTSHSAVTQQPGQADAGRVPAGSRAVAGEAGRVTAVSTGRGRVRPAPARERAPVSVTSPARSMTPGQEKYSAIIDRTQHRKCSECRNPLPDSAQSTAYTCSIKCRKRRSRRMAKEKLVAQASAKRSMK